MPKIEIRLPNSEEFAKELLQTKEIKTMHNGFEVKSHKKFKWSINMKRHSTSPIKKFKFKQETIFHVSSQQKLKRQKNWENEHYQTLGGQAGNNIKI